MSDLCVRIRVAREHYALSVEEVLEVAEPGEMAPVPGSPTEIIGVRNLRGQIVPVICLATLLGLPPEAPERIVVAELGARRAALAVESVLDVEALPDSSEPNDSPYVAGAALVDGTLVGMLDLDAILSPVGSRQVGS
jgi:purine-binding chemotaxis protein CheW